MTGFDEVDRVGRYRATEVTGFDEIEWVGMHRASGLAELADLPSDSWCPDIVEWWNHYMYSDGA